MRAVTWAVVIPVKRLRAAKSRLREAFDPERRAALALALTRDTVSAVRGCPDVAEVLVVCDDDAVAAAVARLGARVAPDLPGDGLNAALRYGADTVAGLGRHRAALAADLPALRGAELSGALRAAGLRAGAGVRAGPGRCFLPDAAGSGTVLLTAAPGVPLDPRFGPGSAAAHAASGAYRLTGDWPGLRRDVDTAADLRAALALGAGPHTTALLADLGLVVADSPPSATSAGHHNCKIDEGSG